MNAVRPAHAARVAVAVLGGLALAGCGPRYDVADMAVGLAPFEELRGMPFRALRVGQVRAMRASAERAPLEGLREQVGAFDVLYAVPGYTGADDAWPDEAALIDRIEATREWPTDSLAEAAYQRVRGEYRSLSGRAARCLDVSGRDFTLRVAEWDLGDGFSFTATYAPSSRLANGTALPPLHSVAVRRESMRDRFPTEGAPNPNDHPTWRDADCDAD